MAEEELVGWGTFFEELGRFLQSSSRDYDSANDRFANYVVERLEVCIIALHGLKENLQEAIANATTAS